jgi:tetratricopeptide (TPR) repeat protein
MTSGSTHRNQRTLEAAEGYLLLNMPEQALRELSSIRDWGPLKADWLRLRGEVLRSEQRHDEALEAFQQADLLAPDEVHTLLGIAWCYKRIDRVEDAIQTMLRAYRACPKEPIVLYNIACYFSLAGDKRQALSWLGRALRMSPDLRELIADETDFDRLRDDPDFHLVVDDLSGEDEI